MINVFKFLWVVILSVTNCRLVFNCPYVSSSFYSGFYFSFESVIFLVCTVAIVLIVYFCKFQY